MKIIESILTKNPCYTAGDKIKVKGLMLHSIGCAQPSAEVFVKGWNTPKNDWSCVHAFIDGNTGDVYQTLPWDHYGWHCGGSANGTHIGVEMCEPACIEYVGGASFTCSDVATAKAVALRTYNSAVLLFAYLCKKYNLDPLADGVIIGHKEGCNRGVASNHADPEHLWKQLNMGLTMDTFRKAVKNSMSTETTTETTTDVIYRVQVGAYKKKANAEAMLEKLKAAGFDGFIATSEKPKTAEPVKPVEPVVAFAEGDMVKLSAGATVYGKTTTFASWVYNSTLYVRQVDGDRIVISTQKTGAITGATDKKHLTKI